MGKFSNWTVTHTYLIMWKEHHVKSSTNFTESSHKKHTNDTGFVQQTGFGCICSEHALNPVASGLKEMPIKCWPGKLTRMQWSS